MVNLPILFYSEYKRTSATCLASASPLFYLLCKNVLSSACNLNEQFLHLVKLASTDIGGKWFVCS